MSYTKSEELLIRQAASGRFQGQYRSAKWAIWVIAALFSVGVVLKVAGEPNSTNIVFGMGCIGFMGMAIGFIQFKYRALGLIQKLHLNSNAGNVNQGV